MNRSNTHLEIGGGNTSRGWLAERRRAARKVGLNVGPASPRAQAEEVKHMLLRQLFELKHYNFVDESMSWQEALRKCIDPLLADGSVEPEYADCLIENVEKRGPYIVLLPGVAMPHAVEGAVALAPRTIPTPPRRSSSRSVMSTRIPTCRTCSTLLRSCPTPRLSSASRASRSPMISSRLKWTLDSAQPLGDELGSVFHGGEPV